MNDVIQRGGSLFKTPGHDLGHFSRLKTIIAHNSEQLTLQNSFYWFPIILQWFSTTFNNFNYLKKLCNFEQFDKFNLKAFHSNLDTSRKPVLFQILKVRNEAEKSITWKFHKKLLVESLTHFVITNHIAMLPNFLEFGEHPCMLTLESWRFPVLGEVYFCTRTLPNR